MRSGLLTKDGIIPKATAIILITLGATRRRRRRKRRKRRKSSESRSWSQIWSQMWKKKSCG